jgi:hypothetical protein
MTPEDLERRHEQDVARQRAYLRGRYAYLTSKIKEAEALGADISIIKSLKTLLAFVIRDANLLDRDEAVRALTPKAAVGAKFCAGRKRGTIGPVRAWLRKYLMKHPGATTAQAWAALAKRPPKGMTVRNNRLGRYIETAGHADTSYRQFQNLVSLERPKK